MDDYQKTIALSRYSRWIPELGRRETWDETVERAITWLVEFVELKTGQTIKPSEVEEIKEAVKSLDVMPSMRLLQYAGEAMDKNLARLFNCTALRLDTVESFSEVVFLSMAGCGVGGRITKDQVDNLPKVPDTITDTDEVYVVQDTLIGWAEAVDHCMKSQYSGLTPTYDFSLIRPKGARLKTAGGYAPGPKPLEDLISKIKEVFSGAMGRRLRPIEVYDIFTMIASIVVAGGSRRSALITLFSPNDRSMMESKKGDWWTRNPNFAYSNNSASFLGRPNMKDFFSFWHDVFQSGAGEPGFVNANAARKQSERFDRPVDSEALLVNPCCEIYSFKETFLCNLTNVTVRPRDGIRTLKRKMKHAATLGYWQALVTDFEFVRPVWKENAEAERLLGVSMSGICDHKILGTPTDKSAEMLQVMRSHVKNVADKWADRFGTSKTVSWTTVKPSGNSGELVGAASGIHPRFSPYYIRRIQMLEDDPMSTFLKDEGVPWEDSKYAANTLVFSFPRKSPEGALTAKTMTAMDQCRLWKHYKSNYATHTISCTVYVRDHEWMEVGAWVYENFEDLVGISFLPYDDHTYEQAPYEAISEDVYLKLSSNMKKFNWGSLVEVDDTTDLVSTQECSGAGCEYKPGG